MITVYIIYLYFLYVSCFITGCIFIRKGWALEYKFLVVLLGFTLLVEGAYTVLSKLHYTGDWLYNFFNPVEAAAFLYLFYKSSIHPAIKKWNIFLLILLPVAVIAGTLIQPAFYRFQSYSLIFYYSLYLLSSLSLFFQMALKRQKKPLLHMPIFWCAAGIGVFSSISILLTALLEYYLARYSFVPRSFIWGLGLANTFEYTGITACFICLHRSLPAQAPIAKT